MDAAGEHGDRGRTGGRLRAGQDRPRWNHPQRHPRRRPAAGAGRRRRGAARPVLRRGAGRGGPALPPPARRSELPGRDRRLRHPRGRHRPRAHGAGPRHRGLRDRPARGPRHLLPGARRRHLRRHGPRVAARQGRLGRQPAGRRAPARVGPPVPLGQVPPQLSARLARQDADIFRATEQWFVAVDRAFGDDGRTLRERALEATESGIEFVPEWGRNRMRGMLESRPDWCISRQRAWGLPIPAFTAPGGEQLLTAASVRAVAAFVREHGSDAWFVEPPQRSSPATTRRPTATRRTRSAWRAPPALPRSPRAATSSTSGSSPARRGTR